MQWSNAPAASWLLYVALWLPLALFVMTVKADCDAQNVYDLCMQTNTDSFNECPLTDSICKCSSAKGAHLCFKQCPSDPTKNTDKKQWSDNAAYHCALAKTQEEAMSSSLASLSSAAAKTASAKGPSSMSASKSDSATAGAGSGAQSNMNHQATANMVVFAFGTVILAAAISAFVGFA
ncbi:hypothetical protein GQ42DRAFT_172588 [Ramicandelaber brevisporus]|nr:hypothetical protein GQ42DRAFT_172588 [Ramicandelaber brevisporus]